MAKASLKQCSISDLRLGSGCRQLRGLEYGGDPLFITVHGRVVAVAVSVEDYQAMTARGRGRARKPGRKV